MTQNRQYTIVVGYDASAGARAALAWAIAEARLRGARVRAVMAWTPGAYDSDQEQADTHRKQLEEGVADLLGSGNDTPVETVAERGHPVEVLSEHARGADMLVVGSRGHGTASGLVLGSVSQRVGSTAGAPVIVIVRP